MPWPRAVAPAGFTVTRLAVREIPRSGTPDELLDSYGISARHIVGRRCTASSRHACAERRSARSACRACRAAAPACCADCSALAQLAPSADRPVGVQDPAWAPDGKRIAVS